MMNTNKQNTFIFENGIKRLEEIVAHFDEGGLTLDQMESLFEEGIQLAQKCSERLDQIEAKVTQAVKEQDGQWTEKPFTSGMEHSNNQLAQ